MSRVTLWCPIGYHFELAQTKEPRDSQCQCYWAVLDRLKKIYQVATFHSVTGAPLLYFVRVLGIVFRHISYIQCQCQTNCCLFRKMKLSCTALILIDNLYYFDVLCLCLQWILQAYCWRLCASACNVRSVVHNFYCLTVRLVKSKLLSALLATAPKPKYSIRYSFWTQQYYIDNSVVFWNSETCDFDFA